jgi:hypothetical protein
MPPFFEPGDELKVLFSSDPTAGFNNFSTMPAGNSFFPFSTMGKPWLKVARANNLDRLYVGLNSRGFSTQDKIVRFSLDGGTKWNDATID